MANLNAGLIFRRKTLKVSAGVPTVLRDRCEGRGEAGPAAKDETFEEKFNSKPRKA